ncbi:MAG TPA: hypothetical protein DER23_00095, partial [Clostridiales bacterium]|nr:hypothetical protein [Clostridiales bacterium]
QPAETLLGDRDGLVSENGSGVIDCDIWFDRHRLAGVIVAAAQVVGVPALRHGSPVDAGIGEQRRYAEQLDILKIFFSGVYA